MEVNTVDPQVSKNIEESKKNGLFVKEYRIDSSVSSLVDIKESWIEYCWKNESGSLRRKIRTSGVQLCLKINNFKSPILNENKYFINWQMEGEKLGIVGRQNELYILYIYDEVIPNIIKIQIKEIRSDELRMIDSFKLYSKL